MIFRILRFFGFYDKTEESLVLLEERADHLRKHIRLVHERLDHMDETINKLVNYLEKK